MGADAEGCKIVSRLLWQKLNITCSLKRALGGAMNSDGEEVSKAGELQERTNAISEWVTV